MLLHIQGLSKAHASQPVFSGISLQLQRGEFVALQGESGVGKSTLLNCIAGLDRADAGLLQLNGVDVGALDEAGGAALRREHLGFVFQAFHLLPHLSVFDNVGLPLRLLGRYDPQRVHALLHSSGLAALAQRLPAQLSGGQMQRVALARALVHGPALVLADEPTGNLDPRSADAVLDLLAAGVAQGGSACLLVTHSVRAAARAQRRLCMRADGLSNA